MTVQACDPFYEFECKQNLNYHDNIMANYRMELFERELTLFSHLCTKALGKGNSGIHAFQITVSMSVAQRLRNTINATHHFK